MEKKNGDGLGVKNYCPVSLPKVVEVAHFDALKKTCEKCV